MGRRDKRIQAAVDCLLLDQGSYAPVELFLHMGRLPYERYEAWRSGEMDYLEDALVGNVDRSLEELKTAADWAVRLGLVATRQQYTGWGSNSGKILHFCRSPDGERLFSSLYQRAPSQEPQLDLFLDSGATPLLKALCQALAGHDRTRADARLQELLSRYPDHRLRSAAESLCDALAHLEDSEELLDPLAEMNAVEVRLAPMAGELLGKRAARDFLAPFWRRLGRSLACFPFDPRQERAHASWAYAQCLDWKAVQESIMSTRGALEQPVLLGRLAEACWRLNQRAQAVNHWCRLCWQSPDHAAAVFARPGFPDSVVDGAWEEFQDLELEPEPDWFPAWLLLTEPGLARALAPDLASDTAGAQRGFRVIQKLLSDDGITEEQQIDLRRQLQSEHAGFLTLFLKRRRVNSDLSPSISLIP